MAPCNVPREGSHRASFGECVSVCLGEVGVDPTRHRHLVFGEPRLDAHTVVPFVQSVRDGLRHQIVT